jgi:hypothetical protein
MMTWRALLITESVSGPGELRERDARGRSQLKKGQRTRGKQKRAKFREK